MATTTQVFPFRNINSTKLIYIVASLVGLVASIIYVRNVEEVSTFPTAISDPFKFAEWVNQAESWLRANYREFTRMIAGVIEQWLYFVEDFLIESPWIFVLLLLVLPAMHFGGLPLAMMTIIGGLFWGGVGMWESTMQTLALMGLSVVLSIIIGVSVGVISSQNDRVEAILKPILDTMQTMPAFVYLVPAVFFFGIGGPPAILATMIYALPPAIRLTNLGIRQISHETLEAAESFGATRIQSLFKVQIPMALPSIMLGVNQTIMMALGLVVLATFIGAGGLGSEVWKAIYKLKVGWSLEGGLCIVFMAIIFDRMSLAFGTPKSYAVPENTIPFRFFPQSWDIKPFAIRIEKFIAIFWNSISSSMKYVVGQIAFICKPVCGQRFSNYLNNHVYMMSSIFILGAILLYDSMGPGIGEFPDALRFTFREPVDNAVAWLTVNPSFIAFTKGLKAVVYLYMLHPLDVYLTELPWYIVVGAITAVSWVSVGYRFGIVCFGLLIFIGACDLWAEAMLTLSSVLVSVFICFVFGLPLGIAAASSKRFNMILKPILDAMQTLPAFVYLIPVLMFFGGNIVSAVIATVIYALPPVIRLTTLGVSQISVTYTEVSSSFGGTKIQTMSKVKLPMALPSIMLGLNQAVMMGLAMQVVTPLIGGAGLGREVFNALNTSDTGAGLASGIGVVLLAIILDRLSQAWTQTQRKALGL